MQLIRRYWTRSRDHGRRRGLLFVEKTSHEQDSFLDRQTERHTHREREIERERERSFQTYKQDSFLERHGMARDRRPTSDVINVVQHSHHRSVRRLGGGTS